MLVLDDAKELVEGNYVDHICKIDRILDQAAVAPVRFDQEFVLYANSRATSQCVLESALRKCRTIKKMRRRVLVSTSVSSINADD